MHDPKTQGADRPDYIRPLKARWWLIVIVGLVAAVGTYRYYAGKPVFYQASTTLYMLPASNDNATSGAQISPDFLQNQALLLRTNGIAVQAARDLGFKGDPAALLGSVTVTPITGADFLAITATSSNPVDAGRIANAFAQAYIATQETTSQHLAHATIKQLQQQLAAIPTDAAHADQRSQLASQIAQLQVYASTPTAPAKQVQPAGLGVAQASSPKSHALYGLVLGLLIGAALAYALDALSRRVKRIEDIELLYGAPVIAKIPSVTRRVCAADPRQGLQAPIDEAFRGLRAALQLRSITVPSGAEGIARLRTIMVASAAASDGKSTVARNLALAYVEAGLRVALVDCDLRRPDLSRSFRVDPQPGLPELLAGAAMTSETLRQVKLEIDFLPAIGRAEEVADVAAGHLPALRDGAQPELAMTSMARADSTIRQAVRGLSVLPSSIPPWNPAAIFAGGRFEAVLQGLRADHDIIILDTSPMAAVSDAAALLPLVDGVLLVSRVRETPTAAVDELRSVLDAVPTVEILGVVANDVRQRIGRYYGYSRAYATS